MPTKLSPRIVQGNCLKDWNAVKEAFKKRETSAEQTNNYVIDVMTAAEKNVSE